jgi:hypothetical protein
MYKASGSYGANAHSIDNISQSNSSQKMWADEPAISSWNVTHTLSQMRILTGKKVLREQNQVYLTDTISIPMPYEEKQKTTNVFSNPRTNSNHDPQATILQARAFSVHQTHQRKTKHNSSEKIHAIRPRSLALFPVSTTKGLREP